MKEKTYIELYNSSVRAMKGMGVTKEEVAAIRKLRRAIRLSGDETLWNAFILIMDRKTELTKDFYRLADYFASLIDEEN